MTLKEFFEQNGEKPIEIQDDGTIKVLEEKGLARRMEPGVI